jgi:hypothetical protein
MDGLDREPYGSVPLWGGTTRPPLLYGIDPRFFLPVGLLILIGVFARALAVTFIFFGSAVGLLVLAGILGRCSPYFIDEFVRWMEWRSRTGSGTISPDAYFHALDSPSAQRRRSS